jgi:outer membrane protein
MKKLLIFIILLVFVFGYTNAGYSETLKVGYVNLGKIFDEYEKTKEYDKVLESQGGQKQKERDKLVNEIKRLKDELELLSDKGKEEKQNQIDSKVTELRKFDTDVREELSRQRDNFLKEILKEIQATVEEYGQKEKYTMIVRSEGMVIYGDKSVDLTDQVIKVLNERYKKK